MTEPTAIRLNKFISDTGICSRREADRFIEDGQVRINGQVALMGTRVNDGDEVTLRGKPLRANPTAVYLVYNKPVGITCTTDSAEPTNIVDAVGYPQRIFPIGRLDKPSEGLILLTNDGNIVNKILRAGNAHEKEYIVTVDHPFGDEFVRRLAQPIPILGTMTKPCKVRQLSADTFNIILTQGLNRQIRRMTEFLGYEVVKLKRVRIMNVQLSGLRPGQWRELTPKEKAEIDKMVASSSGTEDASKVTQSVGRPAGKPATRRAGKPAARTTGKPTNKPAGKFSGKPDSNSPSKSGRANKASARVRAGGRPAGARKPKP